MIKLFKILFILKCGIFLLFFQTANANEKIKIGLLVPMTGSNKEIGQSIIKAVSLAVKDIDNNLIEIYPKDTASRPNQTLKSAFELKQLGIKVIIGPVFHESLTYLDEMKDLTFLSLTKITSPEIIFNDATKIIKERIMNITFFSTLSAFIKVLF